MLYCTTFKVFLCGTSIALYIKINKKKKKKGRPLILQFNKIDALVKSPAAVTPAKAVVQHILK